MSRRCRRGTAGPAVIQGPYDFPRSAQGFPNADEFRIPPSPAEHGGGGIEHLAFFRAAGEPAAELTIPPPAPPPMDRVMAAAVKYKIEVLGPLPT